MLIAIDAHNLEDSRTGVGVYLFRLLSEWEKMYEGGHLAGLDFILYFKERIPEDVGGMEIFSAKILKAPLGVKSNALFTHYLTSRAAKSDNADILFAPNYVLPVLYNKKAVVTIHDLIYEAKPDLYNWPSGWDKIFLKRWGRLSAEKASAILAPSNFTKNEIITYYKINPDKIIVTPLAVSEEFQYKADEAQIAELKRRLGIYDKYILFVGSIFNRRHVPEIIQAFENIFPRFANHQLVIIGSNHTNPYQDIERIILTTNGFLQDTLKIKDRLPVIHQSYLDQRELMNLYNGARASIYLSDYEGFGLPILESMASGTPVITSRQEALLETAGDAALFIDDNSDIEEIAEKMALILLDDDLRQKLRQRGLDQVNKFSWSRCALRTLTVFKKVLAK